MTYLIIASWDENSHPTRINQKATQAEADEIVQRLHDRGDTQAFAVDTPHANADPQHLIVDPVAKTVTLDTASQRAEDEAAVKSAINAERDRRRYPGQVDTGLGFSVDLRHSDDEKNIAGQVAGAIAAKLAGTAETFDFIDANNVTQTLSADDMIAVGNAVRAYVGGVVFKAKMLKDSLATMADAELTALDVTADEHWTA